ncbi:MAG TPA: crotonase [Candidatus Atribacteria bacterium]|nr:crotonase [Candidatus Atribacteria bacterium]
MSDLNNIIYTVESNIATITFHRPNALNAMNTESLSEFSQALNEANSDDNVKCIVLTGSGEKAFVAGADIKELHKKTPVEAMAYVELGNGVCRYLEMQSKPSIAAVNGVALGGGTEIAMSCDIRFASENARFGQPEILLGIIPGWGGTQRLPRLIGEGRALEFLMTGEYITAQRAYEIGLVNRLFPQKDLLEQAKEFAAKLISMPGFAIKMLKTSVYNGLNMDMASALNLEIQCICQCFSTHDQKEGMMAFIERRKPLWQGK